MLWCYIGRSFYNRDIRVLWLPLLKYDIARLTEVCLSHTSPRTPLPSAVHGSCHLSNPLSCDVSIPKGLQLSDTSEGICQLIQQAGRDTNTHFNNLYPNHNLIFIFVE